MKLPREPQLPGHVARPVGKRKVGIQSAPVLPDDWVGTVTLNVRVAGAKDVATARSKIHGLLQVLPGARITNVYFENPIIALRAL